MISSFGINENNRFPISRNFSEISRLNANSISNAVSENYIFSCFQPGRIFIPTGKKFRTYTYTAYILERITIDIESEYSRCQVTNEDAVTNK